MPLANLPQTNMQHPVPQNIMDVEFKLIGDLTMRQFAYLMVFGLTAYLSYLLVIGIFKWPTVFALILLGLGLAFVPVEERGLDEWIVNFVKAINSSTQRVWKKEPQIPSAFLYDSIAVVKQEMITLAPTSSRRKLEEYLKYQKEGEYEDPLDIPEREYVLKVREAYPFIPKPSPSSVGVAVEEPVEEPVVEIPEEEIKPEEEHKEESKKQEIPLEAGEVSKEAHIIPRVAVETKVPTTTLEAQGLRVSKPKEKVKEKIKEEVFIMPEKITAREQEVSYEPITPDMHSGRRFVNLVPSQGGELVLPIRGERVLKTSEDIETEEGLVEKASQLKDLLKKIREEEGITEVPMGKEAETVVGKLKQQNEDLNKEIERLRNQISRGKSMSLETETQEQLLKRLESQKEKIATSYTELRRQVQDLQKKLGEKTATSTGLEFMAKRQGQIAVMTDKPNILTGVIKDSGGKYLSEVLLIVKNSRGEAVRALKTNILGQFVVTTPLQNGTYTVEVSPVNKTTLTFDIIPIEVKGEIVPPLEMVGK